jgi:hypothetical protein
MLRVKSPKASELVALALSLVSRRRSNERIPLRSKESGTSRLSANSVARFMETILGRFGRIGNQKSSKSTI